MNPVYDFKGKVALVTGASSGMGLATAKAFAESGAAVALVDINHDRLSAATEGLTELGLKAIGIVCDVADEVQAKAAVDRTVAEFGRLDMAYNNAGILGPMCEMSDETSEGYNETQAINLRGIWTFMKHELRQMKKQGSGAIVNCSSLGGLVGLPGRAAYHASKHGGPRPIAAKKSFTIWTFFCVLIDISPLQDRIEICDYDSSVELDQVLKDQLTPAISARLHKQSTFRKAAKFDRRETEIFRMRTNLRCGAVIVARQEHDSSATLYGRILGKDGCAQMIEALNQSSTSEGLCDDLGRRLSSQFLRGHAVGIGHIDDDLARPSGQRLRDIPVRLVTDSQKDDVSPDGIR